MTIHEAYVAIAAMELGMKVVPGFMLIAGLFVAVEIVRRRT